MGIREVAYQAGVDRNWNAFRELYSQLSIEDLIWINTQWDAVLPYQRSASVGRFGAMFNKIKEDLRVVELGCYRGELASHILTTTKANIWSWGGYDINHTAVEEAVKHKKFSAFKLNQWFWEKDLVSYNTFVCSHTLEHFSFPQAEKILKNASVCKYIMLELPLDKWDHYCGSHVLEATVEQLDEILSKTHIKFFDESKYDRPGSIMFSGWKHLT